MRDEKEAKAKREEIKDIVRGVIDGRIDNVDKFSDNLVSHFCEITPPEIDTTMHLMTIKPGGMGGGRSSKPGNIWLNWRKLLVDGSESILTVVGAVSIPWLIPFAALVVWNKICSLCNLEISERHAAVVWTMWQNRDETNCVEPSAIAKLVNTELLKYNRPKMNKKELNAILEDLKNVQCIEISDDGKLWLREWVKTVYD
jgi:hypothetical protein